MAQVLWNVARKNSVFSDISDVEYLFCSQRNLLPSNWPWVGSTANCTWKKREETYLPLLRLHGSVCNAVKRNLKVKSVWQKIYCIIVLCLFYHSIIVSRLWSVRPLSHVRWTEELVKTLVQEIQSFSKALQFEVCFISALDDGVWSLALHWASDPKTNEDVRCNSAQIFLLVWYFWLIQVFKSYLFHNSDTQTPLVFRGAKDAQLALNGWWLK